MQPGDVSIRTIHDLDPSELDIEEAPLKSKNLGYALGVAGKNYIRKELGGEPSRIERPIRLGLLRLSSCHLRVSFLPSFLPRQLLLVRRLLA